MYIEDTPGSLTWLRFGSTSPLYRWTQKWDPRRRSTHTYLCKPPILLYIGSLLPRPLQKIHLFVIRDQWDSGIYTKFYNFKIIIIFFLFSNSFFLTWSVLVLWCFFSLHFLTGTSASSVNVFLEAMSDCRGNGSSYENTAN